MDLRLNPHISRLLCSLTGQEVETDMSRPIGMHQVPDYGPVPLAFEYDLANVALTKSRAPFVAPEGKGIWRYAPLLPVHGVSEAFAADVGRTPCILQPQLGDALGVELHIKSEGSNPSGSFKDRGLSVGVALGLALGAKRFCLPTQGNAGIAASLFSARAGIEPALVYMPDSHRGSIYHRCSRGFGAEVRFFGSNIAAAGKKMREDLAEPLGAGEYVDISTFFEPGRLEGKKTLGLEIVESFGTDALPQVIIYPTGGGTGLVGIWKAFNELRDMGVIAPGTALPRMIAVQSENCAPVVAAFARGDQRVTGVASQGTVADGLDVPGAIMGHAILRTLRDSSGSAVAVSERDIIDTHAQMGRAGVSACFEGAATLAALKQLRKTGEVQAGERVLLLNTAGALTALSSAGARRIEAMS